VKNLIALRIIFVPLFIILIFFFLSFKSYAVTPTMGSWTFVGLNNSVIHSFAVDPNNPTILYAGTVGNGIFKSTDKGIIGMPLIMAFLILPPVILLRL